MTQPRRSPHIYILIGPPGAGKSAWRSAFIDNSPLDMSVISSDDLIEEMAAAEGLTYSEMFSRVDQKEITRRTDEGFAQAVAAKQDIILDRTNMSRKSRARYLSRLPKSYVRYAVDFIITRKLLDERLALRGAATGKFIPKQVVDDMLRNYQPPQKDEGFDSVIVVQNNPPDDINK